MVRCRDRSRPQQKPIKTGQESEKQVEGLLKQHQGCAMTGRKVLGSTHTMGLKISPFQDYPNIPTI